MSNSVIYLVLAYVGTALLYGVYAVWLLGQERRLAGRSRDTAR